MTVGGKPRRRLAPNDVIMLFAFQGGWVPAQPLVIPLLVAPAPIQVRLNAGLAYWLARRFGVTWCVAAPGALIGASKVFEVPVMPSVARIVTAPRGWYKRHP